MREGVFWRLSHAFVFSMDAALVNFAFVGILFLGSPTTARAQDPFEIHVYEYEELPPGGFTLEGHFNFAGIGTKSFKGTVAPTDHQFHMTGFGIGVGLTHAGNRLIYKSRLEYSFGRKGASHD